jgi:hypothetical protein
MNFIGGAKWAWDSEVPRTRPRISTLRYFSRLVVPKKLLYRGTNVQRTQSGLPDLSFLSKGEGGPREGCSGLGPLSPCPHVGPWGGLSSLLKMVPEEQAELPEQGLPCCPCKLQSPGTHSVARSQRFLHLFPPDNPKSQIIMHPKNQP